MTEKSKRAGACDSAVTTKVVRAQADALATATKFYEASKVCHCAECNALDLKGHALGLVKLIIASMDYLGQRWTKEYFDVLRLRASLTASFPAYASGNGAAIVPLPRVDPECRRKRPAAKYRRVEERLTRRLQGVTK